MLYLFEDLLRVGLLEGDEVGNLLGLCDGFAEGNEDGTIGQTAALNVSNSS